MNRLSQKILVKTTSIIFILLLLDLNRLWCAVPPMDTIYIIVLKPSISASHQFSETELGKLDVFCKTFKLHFSQIFQDLSRKKCATSYYQVIDYENEGEIELFRKRFGTTSNAVLPHCYFRGDMIRQTDGYLLSLSMKSMNNTINLSNNVDFLFSEADNSNKAKESAWKIAQSMIDYLCGVDCHPNVLLEHYEIQKNEYYRNVSTLIAAVSKFNFSLQNADEKEENILQLLGQMKIRKDELFLSHTVAIGLFWKNARKNCPKAIKYFEEAQNFYCYKATNLQDVELLKSHFVFEQFDEFIQNQIQICKSQ